MKWTEKLRRGRRNTPAEKLLRQISNCVLESLETRCLLSGVPILVTTSADSGAGSLRQAILDANAAPGTDEIRFDLPAGSTTIALQSALPQITEQLLLNGASQPGYSGLAPIVGIDGAAVTSGAGLDIGATYSDVRALAVYNFRDSELLLSAGFSRVTGCWIGLTPDGLSGQNQGTGIFVNSPGNEIGGPAALARNVVSSNDIGIHLTGAGATSNTVSGNYVGLAPNGVDAAGNATAGIQIDGEASLNSIGGIAGGAGNVISGNGTGVIVQGALSLVNRISGNIIGTDASASVAVGNGVGVLMSSTGANYIGLGYTDSGTLVRNGNVIAGNSGHGLVIANSSTISVAGNNIGVVRDGTAIPNGGDGIRVDASQSIVIGASGVETESNVIAFNAGHGIAVTGSSSEGVSIEGNRIFRNGATQIDLGADGLDAIDVLDGDTGPNTRINRPEIGSATASHADLTIRGQYQGAPQQNFTLEFYSIPSGQLGLDPQAGRVLGTTSITTNSDGLATFDTTLTGALVSAGSFVTAIATDDNSNSSEFADLAAVGGGGQTFTVTSAADSGPGSLRQAILDANANSGADTIRFAVDPGPDVSIHLLSALPAISESVFLDGAPQSGPLNRPVVELDGSAITGPAHGLDITGNWVQVRELVINGFSGDGIHIQGAAASSANISFCYIGTDALGSAARPNSGYGIYLDSAAGAMIGGEGLDFRNVISGNASGGIFATYGMSTSIYNNVVGLDRELSASIGNGGDGIYLGNDYRPVIGGSGPGMGNIIGGNQGAGLHILASDFAQVEGNAIGEAPNDGVPAPNSGEGLLLEDSSSAQVNNNAITGNGGDGVRIVGSSVYNELNYNQIWNNTGLGIDLGGDGVTPNDAGDVDNGPDFLQNFPVITGAQLGAGGDITVDYTLDSAPDTTYLISFFRSMQGDATGYGEGQYPIGYDTVTTDGSGHAVGNVSLSTVGNSAGAVITATAFGVSASEFSAGAVLQQSALDVTAIPMNVSAAYSFTHVIAKVSAPGSAPGDLTATIDWGDGSAQESLNVVDAGGGLFNLEGTHTYATPGLFDVSVEMSHIDGRTGSAGTYIIANAKGLYAGGISFNGDSGQELPDQVVATFYDPIAAGGITYSADIDWGDGSPTDTGSVVDLGNGHFEVLGTHTYTSANTFQVHISIASSDSRQTSATSIAQIIDSALVGAGVDVTGVAGQELASVEVATFTDPLGSTASDFSAYISWSDGTSPEYGTIVDLGGGQYKVVTTHTFAAPGTYTAAIGISHTDGRQTVVLSSAIIASSQLIAAGVDVSGEAGVPLDAVEVATFTDPLGSTASDFTATIDWGDGTSPDSGVVVDLGGGQYEVQGTHTFSVSDAYTMGVSISHTDGRTASAVPVATISASTDLVATGGEISGEGGTALDAVVLADFTDPLGSTAGDFTATIDWGDDTSGDTGTVVSLGGGQYQVLGSHTYSYSGDYSIGVIIVHTDTRSASAIATATISRGTLQTYTVPEIDGEQGVPLNRTTASFVGPLGSTASSFTATIDWGDGSSPDTGTIQIGSDGPVFTVLGTHTYASAGTFQVSTLIEQVVDGDATATQTTPAAIVLPALQEQATTVSGNVNVPLSAVAVAMFSDPLGSSVSDFTATIDWGDDSSSEPGVVESAGDGSYIVRGNHTYSDAADYPISVSIAHTDGRTLQVSTEAVIVQADLLLDVNPDFPAQAHHSTSGTIGYLNDPSGTSSADDFTVTINWGDGTPDTPGTLVPTEGGWDIQAAHKFAQAGSATVTILVQHTDGRTAEGSADLQVVVPALQITTSEYPYVNFGSTTDGLELARIYDEATDLAPNQYAVSIDWGDGTTTPGSIEETSPGVRVVRGSHLYLHAGSFDMTITVTDRTDSPPGRTQTADQQMQVSGEELPVRGINVVAIEGFVSRLVRVAAFRANEVTSTSPFTASIDWGDGQTSPGAITRLANGWFIVRGTHIYRTAARRPVTTIVHQQLDSELTAVGISQSTAAALNAPRLPIAVINQFAAGRLFSGRVFAFLDANRAAVAGDYRAQIDWGDGRRTTGSVARGSGIRFDINGHHAYRRKGIYTLRILVEDSTGDTFVQTQRILVR